MYRRVATAALRTVGNLNSPDKLQKSSCSTLASKRTFCSHLGSESSSFPKRNCATPPSTKSPGHGHGYSLGLVGFRSPLGLAPMEAEETCGVGGHSTGRKLEPWLSWAEWRFVRDAIFSSYPDHAAALRRIAAWRGRGCLPIPVDVTAAFVEIRLRDPFFQNGVAWDDKLESEEMLAMLYSMAIMRLVNGFLENPHKEIGRSISQLAEVVGIPRILVDIRHESSHRGLPSVRLLRLAAIKAFDWLKCIYWDSQAKAIPDTRLELSSLLHGIARFMKGKDSKKVKSGSKRKRSEKVNSAAIKYVRRLYYACPSEVVSVLLDLFQLEAPEPSKNSDVHQTDSLDVNHSSDVQNQISNSDLKIFTTELSEKEPRVLLGILKSVIEMIETREDLENKDACLPTGPSKMKNLCSLVQWVVTNIKELKDSGSIGLVHEIGVLSSDRNAVPRFCLAKLLQKCLSLSIVGDRCMADAALLLIEMASNYNVKEKLKKLPMLSLQSLTKDCTLVESRIICSEQESVETATEKLKMFKVQLRKPENACLAENGPEGSSNTSRPEKRNRWSIAKSWTPCPLGMIPCSYSSTAVLPPLDVAGHKLKDDTLEHGNLEHDDLTGRYTCCSHPEKQLDDESILEIPRSPPECAIPDMPELTFPLRGRLLVGGVWVKVAEEELLSIKSNMKILL